MERWSIPITLFILLIAWWIFATAMHRWNGWRDTAHEMRVDRDQWRRRYVYLRCVAIDGPCHPGKHLCGKPGDGVYEQCCECWDKAADDAVKEAQDAPV